MNQYRTHTCVEISKNEIGKEVIISGWLNKKRDHGGLLFLDIRDNYGITQCVIDTEHESFSKAESLRLESVLKIKGRVLKRSQETINHNLATGEVEIKIKEIEVLSLSEVIPFQISVEDDAPEELRLKYRYLDLRKDKIHQNILLRSRVINSFRNKMISLGFNEIHTPILSSSSPEGARDFLVPSRMHKGKFYALPQAPQIFKQLLMVGGFDKYFQIAPCFRDEDARADRSPGEFYQLDFEMSFVEQKDILETIEPVLYEIFTEYSKNKSINKFPFPRIKYMDSLNRYGTDKPDLRNPLIIDDFTDDFVDSGFKIFDENIKKGLIVKGIRVPNSSSKPRAWFDKLNDWARGLGQKGLGYIIFEEGTPKGPIAKNLKESNLDFIIKKAKLEDGDCVFFISDKKKNAEFFASLAREKLCDEMDIREKDCFKFCWIVDYPMFELNEESKKIDFSHNPFSMPQGGIESLEKKDPLDILAWQFDIVCNGIELSSGAIRNHKPEIMLKAFEIAGYDEDEIKKQFGAIYKAFKYGAPPHGGSAPGIDRIVMLLAEEKNLREVVAFPLNQQAEDLMLNAPNYVPEKNLKDLNLIIKKEKK
jgi:aspartyl-tRNA synthetase